MTHSSPTAAVWFGDGAISINATTDGTVILHVAGSSAAAEEPAPSIAEPEQTQVIRLTPLETATLIAALRMVAGSHPSTGGEATQALQPPAWAVREATAALSASASLASIYAQAWRLVEASPAAEH